MQVRAMNHFCYAIGNCILLHKSTVCTDAQLAERRTRMIVVNGKEKEFPGAITIRELLAMENYKNSYVAVEQNETIIPREQYDAVTIQDNDRIEIVSFMGGG